MPDDFHGWLKEHVSERHPAKEQSDPAAKARAKQTLKAEYRKLDYSGTPLVVMDSRISAGAGLSF